MSSHADVTDEPQAVRLARLVRHLVELVVELAARVERLETGR